jgi:hypothetical protein
MKKSSYDSLSFPSGLGTAFIKSSTDVHINNPTGAKQETTATTGLITMAGDDTTHYYLHNYIPAIPAGATTSNAATIADTYADAALIGSNFGTSPDVKADGDTVATSYLKFDLTPYAGKTLVSAYLRITTTSASNAGSPGTQTVKAVSDTSWGETALTWQNRPALGSTLGSLSNPSKISTTYDIPLSASQVTLGGLYSVAVSNSSSDAFFFYSKESTGTSAQLVLTYL